MPDQRLELTSQDLRYAAAALRAAARGNERSANDPERVSSRQVYEHAMKVHDALAAKCDQIAQGLKEVTGKDGPRRPRNIP